MNILQKCDEITTKIHVHSVTDFNHFEIQELFQIIMEIFGELCRLKINVSDHL